MRSTTVDDISRLMGKFRGNVDFSDSPNGFFGFVRETFEQLAREEENAAEHAGLKVPDYPSFGHKDDTYEDVVRDFYSAWNGFATVKTFAFLDVYRLSDAPDRRVRRLMEKENKKFRDEGIRQFNDAVRTLVAFVRKRDPRYTPYTQTAEEAAKAQREARKAQAARSRAAYAAKAGLQEDAVPEWARARDPDEVEEETEEEIEEDHYECVACRKTFKSEQQYDAHERSKKHQKAVQALKRKMQKDNAHLHLDEEVTSSGVMTPASAEDEIPVEVAGSEPGVLDDSMDIVDGVEDLKVDDGEGPQLNGSEAEDVTQRKPRAPTDSASTGEDEENDDDEYASRSDVEARLAGFRKAADAPDIHNEPQRPTVEIVDDPLHLDDTPDSENATPAGKKLGKAAQKRAKKAAKQATEQEDLKSKCIGCGKGFATKNQLFQHLKDFPKHAALKQVPQGGKKAKKK